MCKKDKNVKKKVFSALISHSSSACPFRNSPQYISAWLHYAAEAVGADLITV